MDDHHAAAVRAAFAAQAETIEDPRLGAGFLDGLDWIHDLAGPRPDDVAIDVAGGTGLVGRTLAPDVRSVLVADITPAMLEAGRGAAGADGLTNVEFLLADATDLPLPDAGFTLAVTRWSLHHVTEPDAMVDELIRVTAPGGRIVVVDLVADPNPAIAARQNAIEILRDESHVRMLPPGRIGRMFHDRSCQVDTVARRQLDRPLEPWLEQAKTPPDRAAEIRRRLRGEVRGGDVTGVHPSVRDGELWFRHESHATVVRKGTS